MGIFRCSRFGVRGSGFGVGFGRPTAQRDRDFCDDTRRAARSAPANLSEGFHRFRPKDNARFVRIALGSLGEMMNHLRHARKQRYITDDEFSDLMLLVGRTRRATVGWVTYLDSCDPRGPHRPGPKRKPAADASANREPDPEL